MVGLLVVFIASLLALLGFFLYVSRDMRRGLREMERRTREVEALLDPGTRRQA
jgi:pilus assembly protein TadC